MNKKLVYLLVILIILLVVGVSSVAAQNITQKVKSGDNTSASPEGFLPLILMTLADQVGQDTPPKLFIFSSTAMTDGNGNGRRGMFEICHSEDPESHFCSMHEIDNALKATGVNFSPDLSDSWVDRIFTWSDTDNCSGWTNIDPNQYGDQILADASNIKQELCADVQPVACCKWQQ
jgi:hypothetical protein